MKYTGPIFRPPIEANTVLLQVTVGCAHNKCTFCTMYRGTQFCIEQIDQIENDLKEAKERYRSLKRIFLLNGDVFVLSARRLKEISKKIIEYFPEMETITMYAPIRNIITKTDEELRELRDLRINDLWVGLETGNDEILKRFNKGSTLKDSYEQLERLNNAGIRHNAIFMLGTAGRGNGIEAAIGAAKLINKTKPQFVGITSLGFFDGSELTREVKDGTFIPATELEILEEEKKLIELIEVENMPFYGNHPINATSIAGIIPRDREKMIETINYAVKTAGEEFLNSTAERSTL
ncbi:radical SAM protein [Methanococcoides alaskense]|uniref:Radical SAM superfamily enzyme YgiQ (UPF0313 family) n=1 Tax=Methanococcoides alaskense TaxID=325778 RepID=A0AA90U194_9EURY|nr:radical SAM protein [Methanococcoides alaskense]MDA0524277.1 radical SAM protein [Methanococcoides alaskense]MDR6223772.1 radical SAM superfamily enzyme YgiQ (UPF0313 family) [Methanococcoides alaskense]